jgi:hypothetical protein
MPRADPWPRAHTFSANRPKWCPFRSCAWRRPGGCTRFASATPLWTRRSRSARCSFMKAGWSRSSTDPNRREPGSHGQGASHVAATTNRTPSTPLSLAHSCLYSVCHSVILSLGLSPGLGVVHQGNHRSFTLDIADLYKHRVSIPAAFEAVAMSGGMSVPASVIREAMRDKLFRTSFFQNAVSDIVSVFSPDSSAPDVELEDANTWWDGS